MLAPCPYPSPLGTAVCIRGVAQELAALGHKVDVVTYAPTAHGGTLNDGLVHIHAVPKAVVAPRSGPQVCKWGADVHLWRYARDLGGSTSFDAIWGHHVEGIALGRLLQAVLHRPLIGHIHTRLALELPTYWTGRLQRMVGTVAGQLLDTALPHLPDALVTLSPADATAMRHAAFRGPVFVRYPTLTKLVPQGPQPLPRPPTVHPQPPYAIYSGNADTYQNLELLCAAATSGGWPLVIATHGSSSAFERYKWPPNSRIVCVDSFAQMRVWLMGARLGLCPRQQACGYPVKWLNYWHAGLTVVATAAMGRSVFGSAMGTGVHGPALWTADTPQAFDQAIRHGLSQTATRSYVQPEIGPSLDSILAAAHNHYYARCL